MIRLLTVLLALALTSAEARADLTLSQLVGTWTGSGTYAEALSEARMRCRLSIAGDDAKVTLSGRCGSSLGAEDVVLDFIRQGDGSVIVRSGPGAPQQDSKIAALTGRPQSNQLYVTGAAGDESVAMQFVKNADGTLYFATERKWQTGRSHSVITLQPR